MRKIAISLETLRENTRIEAHNFEIFGQRQREKHCFQIPLDYKELNRII